MVTSSVQGSGDPHLTPIRPFHYSHAALLLLPLPAAAAGAARPPARSISSRLLSLESKPGPTVTLPNRAAKLFKATRPRLPETETPRGARTSNATPLHSPRLETHTARASPHTTHRALAPRRARDQGRPRNGAARRCTASHRTAAAGEHGTVHDATGAARTHGHVVVLGTCSATTWSSIERAGAS
jgi:hypothetical protein